MVEIRRNELNLEEAKTHISRLERRVQELENYNALLQSNLPHVDPVKSVGLFYKSQTRVNKPFDPYKVKRFVHDSLHRSPLTGIEDVERIIKEGLSSAYRFLKAEYLHE